MKSLRNTLLLINDATHHHWKPKSGDVKSWQFRTTNEANSPTQVSRHFPRDSHGKSSVFPMAVEVDCVSHTRRGPLEIDWHNSKIVQINVNPTSQRPEKRRRMWRQCTQNKKALKRLKFHKCYTNSFVLPRKLE